MIVSLKLFALARQLAGADVLELEIPDGGRVSDLREALGQRLPALKPNLPHLMFAVNMDYAGDGEIIPPNADLACIPPVSGG